MMKRWMAPLVTVVLALAIVWNLAPRAEAYHTYVTWPTLKIGTRGFDVQALQRFLVGRGYSLTLDGIFGSGTDTAVKDFQSKNGLTADGIVGANTWSKVIITAQSGSTGQAACTVQEQLIVKHSYSLSVDCSFASSTDTAVKNFQSHMGLTADGIVGPDTWKHLIGHFENLTRSSSTGYGWTRYNDEGTDDWGTANAIAYIKRVAQQWYDAGYRPRVQIGDISLPHGGDFSPHASHKKGVDIDIRPIRNDGAEASVCYTDSTYSRSRTQYLVDLWNATGMVRVIYFNDPYVSGVSYASGHDCHFHVSLNY